MNDVSASNLIETTGAKFIVKGSVESEQKVRKQDKVPDHVQIKLFPIDHAFSSLKLRESFQ